MMNSQNLLKLSTIVAGMWRLQDWGLAPRQRVDLIKQSIDLGVTAFDHADIYGDYQCERLFGEALTAQPSLREKIQIISKCGICLVSKNRPQHQIKRYDTSYQHIVNSVESSLLQLATDYLDCLLIHRPDPLMDASEVARAFSDLKQSGKILTVGVSNFLPHQLSLLQSYCEQPLVVNQLEVSVLHSNAMFDGSLDYCQQHNVLPMAWSPLAGGKLFSADSEQSLRVNQALHTIAARHAASVDQIALAWLMRHPAKIKPVVGSGNINRIKAAVKASEIVLQEEEWFAILQASLGHEVA